jgi:hypothetical protein
MYLGTKKLLSMAFLGELNRLFFDLGASVDQDTGSSLAQIQIVAREAVD